MKLRVVALHFALLAAIWLAGIIVYALVFVRPYQPTWILIDAVIACACATVVYLRWDELGISAISKWELLALLVLSLLIVLDSQRITASSSTRSTTRCSCSHSTR